VRRAFSPREARSRRARASGDGAPRALTTVRLLVAGFAMIVSACAEKPAQSAPAPPVIRLITGPAGGTLHVTGASLQREYNRTLTDATIEVVHSRGAVDNIIAIQEGQADLGVTYSDVAYSAFSGRLEQRLQKFDRLAAIAVMQLAPLHIVIGPTSHIRSIVDLRGGRLGMATAAGSGSGITARSVLTILGIPLASVTISPLSSESAYTLLKAGTVDAHLQVGVEPIDWIQKAVQDGARLLPLTEQQVERLGQVYPFFRPTVIRKETYPGLAQSIPTIGVDGLLVCRRDLDEDRVYQLTKGLFQAARTSSGGNGSRFVDVEQAAATPIPLHTGASRFYRERQLSR
jgi:TRAP transporter TAXI family solute receptor